MFIFIFLIWWYGCQIWKKWKMCHYIISTCLDWTCNIFDMWLWPTTILYSWCLMPGVWWYRYVTVTNYHFMFLLVFDARGLMLPNFSFKADSRCNKFQYYILTFPEERCQGIQIKKYILNRLWNWKKDRANFWRKSEIICLQSNPFI